MEEPLLNGESPTITTSTASNQQQQLVQIEENHEKITEGIYATLDQGTNREIVVITPLYRGTYKKLGISFIVAVTSKKKI